MVWAPDPARLAAVDGTVAEPADHAGMTALQVLRRLDTGPKGLTEAEAESRLARHGQNTVPVSATTWRTRLAASGRDPFTLVLAVLAVASACIGASGTATAIAVLTSTSCLLRFHSERRADRAAAAPGALPATTATVLRRAGAGSRPMERDLPVDQLVPGDVVLLAPGDSVPADLRLLRSDALTVDQSALTGESAAVGKHTAAADGDLFDSPRLCFLGSTVTGGSATAVVLATGARTYYGATHAASPRRRTPTAFHREAAGVTGTLVRFMVLAAVAVLAVNELCRDRGPESAALAVAVAVGLTPEMLPVVVNTALARGSAMLNRQQVVVRRLPAVHDLGAMDLLCTDKTGTLTRGRPTLSCRLDPQGNPDSGVLYWAAVNSLLALHHGDLPAADPVDEAVLDAAFALDLPLDPDDGSLSAVAVLPFTPARRRATVVLRGPGRDTHTLVCKGAPEELLARCTRVADGGGPGGERTLDDARREQLRRLVDGRAEEGVSLLAVARARRPARWTAYRESDEDDLTLLGFVGVRDEPLPSAAAALAALADQGVDVRIVTGDHPGVAAGICRAVGLEVPASGIVLGTDTDALDDRELAALAAGTTLFARMTPRHKARLVHALRRGGHRVGFLGEGVNDLPALAAADVGICPEAGVPAARSVADAILLHKDLGALGRAVGTGRQTVGTIADYLRIAVSANLGNAISMIAASVLLPFLPMLPGQVLVQNICFDLAMLALAFERPDPRGTRRPGGFRVRGTTGFVLCFGLLGSLADLTAFAVLGHLTGHRVDPAAQASFRAGWFTENLATQALAMLLLRSGGVRRRPARPVLVAALALLAVGVLLPLSPLAAPLGLGVLPVAWMPLLGAILAGFAGLVLAARLLLRQSRVFQ
jgi:Mg2+-importing ATPase